MKNTIFAIAAFLLFASAAFAQGTIEGTVLNEKAKPIPNLTVTLVDADGTTDATKTDEDGAFGFEDLDAGKYKLTVTVPAGYQPFSQNNVVVNDEGETTVQFVLKRKLAPVPPVPQNQTPANPANNAQPTVSQGYIPDMNALIARLSNPMANQDQVLAGFIKIAEAKKTEALPYYWAAFATFNEMQRYSSPDWIPIADKAIVLLEKALSLSKYNSERSEIYVAMAMASNIHVMARPEDARGEGLKMSEYIDEAIKFDPTNPRICLIQARGVLNTPTQFGGGEANAKPLFVEAIKKFDAFRPQTSISPNWGRAEAVETLKRISQ